MERSKDFYKFTDDEYERFLNGEEIWRDVVGYQNSIFYISFGRVMSVERKVKGRYGNLKTINSRILKFCNNSVGYHHVMLCKLNKKETYIIHKMVAIAFLGHNPCGYEFVVNHINLNKKDNRIQNIEIVTHRENSNMQHIKHSSKYTGVSKVDNNYWRARININNKSYHIGRFKTEYEAHLAYQNELSKL